MALATHIHHGHRALHHEYSDDNDFSTAMFFFGLSIIFFGAVVAYAIAMSVPDRLPPSTGNDATIDVNAL